jgi:hypothetical protein
MVLIRSARDYPAARVFGKGATDCKLRPPQVAVWSLGVGTPTCGPATPVDPTAPLARAVPLGRALWLSVYPFQSGYPTKTIVKARHPLRRRITIRGWNCALGSSLRFWYRNGSLPFGHLPVTASKLRRTGTLSVTFRPGMSVRMGYFMFWRTGLWRIAAYRNGLKIATAIVRAAPD